MPDRIRAALAVLIAALSVFVALDRKGVRRPHADLVASILKASAAASRAWPGYDPLGRPLLIAIKGQDSLLLGTTTYPAGFARTSWAEASVSVGSRTFTPKFSYAKDFDLDGTTVAALSIDGGLNVSDWTGYFIHERFHNAQDGLFKFRSWGRYPVEDPRDVTLARLEGRRLADWVERGDPEAMRDFAAIRERRRLLFPGSAIEIWEEQSEGTAEFVESAGTETAWPRQSVRRFMAHRLRSTVAVSDMAKWRHYSIGAALCLWLDAEKEPNWRRDIEVGYAPSQIVLARLGLTEAEIDRRVAALTRRPDYAEAEEAALRDIDRLRTERKRQLAEYEALPGRRLVLTREGARASHSGPWLDYPDGTELLSAKQWSDERPGYHIRLRDVYVRRGTGRAEFVLPPEVIVLLDGRRWLPKPGRAPFRTLSISAPPRIDLTTGPGRIDDDGKTILLVLDEAPR